MRNLAARLMRSVQFGMWTQPVRSPYGAKLFGHPLDGTFQMIVRDAYGSFTFDGLKQASQECAFLDVGANIGLYSVALGGYFSGPRYSFEPNPDTFKYLQRNLAYAKLPDVHAVCAGLTDQEAASATLNTRRFHSGAASLETSFGYSSQRISLVSPEMLKGLVSSDRPAVLKIDVEGAELNVVRGLAKAGLLAQCERLVIEMSTGTNETDVLSEIRSELVSAGLILRDRSGSDHFGDELYTR